METNHKQDCLNAFNQKISIAYANFAAALDEIERITPETEKYLLEEKKSQIDNLFQNIVNNMRPHLRRYLEI